MSAHALVTWRAISQPLRATGGPVLHRLRHGQLGEQRGHVVLPQGQVAAGEILGVSIQIVASLGILLQPFLPSASKKICLCLTGKPSLPWRSAGQTIIKPGTRVRPLQPLFHKVNAEKLRAGLESIRSRTPIEAEA